jgi:hypothetical protein
LLVVAVSLLILLLVVGMSLIFLWLLKQQMMEKEKLILGHREERINWERERERLLNRSMSKEWTTYAQMVAAGPTSPSTSDEPLRGMSDEEELRRAGFIDQGLGEPFVDLQLDDEMKNILG